MRLITYILEMIRFMSLPSETRQALIRQAETQERLRKAMPPKPTPKPTNEFVTVRYPNGYWTIEAVIA